MLRVQLVCINTIWEELILIKNVHTVLCRAQFPKVSSDNSGTVFFVCMESLKSYRILRSTCKLMNIAHHNHGVLKPLHNAFLKSKCRSPVPCWNWKPYLFDDVVFIIEDLIGFSIRPFPELTWPVHDLNTDFGLFICNGNNLSWVSFLSCILQHPSHQCSN